jgi:probable HAF family extracellular repeat protein
LAAPPLVDLATLDGEDARPAAINDAGDVLINTTHAGRVFLYRDGAVTEITPDENAAGGLAINDAGQVIGHAGVPTSRAFLYDNGTVTWLAPSGIAYDSVATAINGSGQVVGRFMSDAFLYSNGVRIDNLASSFADVLGSTATAINDAGQVIGSMRVGDYITYEWRGFVYSGGVATDLGTLGGTSTSPYDINEAGQIAGDGLTATGNRHAFIYAAGVLTDIGTLGGATSSFMAMNEAGQVVGNSETTTGDTHAFRYSGGVLMDLGTLGGPSSYAYGMNEAGDVVGSAETAAGDTHAFLYSDGVMTDLGTLYGAPSHAYSINEARQVAGLAAGPREDWHAFLHSGGIMMDLGTLGGTSSHTGRWPSGNWVVNSTINEAGQVIGASAVKKTNGGAEHAFVTAPCSAEPVVACPPTPETSCDAGAKSSFRLRDDADDDNDRITWSWSRGIAAVSHPDLGLPQDSTSYRMCIYDSSGGTDVLMASLELPPSSLWTDRNPRGWAYKNAIGSEDGITSLKLQSGLRGRAKLKMTVAGVDTPMPAPTSPTAFFHQDGRVTVQLFNDASCTCWSSEYSDVLENDGDSFSARVP